MLTHADWKDINLALEATGMLTQAEIDAIATWLNGKIGLPFVSERKEQKVIAKLVKKIDRFLYDNLPNEYYELIRMPEDGITEEEAEVMKERLTDLINGVVNIPVVPEVLEEQIFGVIIGLLVDAMIATFDLDAKLETELTPLPAAG